MMDSVDILLVAPLALALYTLIVWTAAREWYEEQYSKAAHGARKPTYTQAVREPLYGTRDVKTKELK